MGAKTSSLSDKSTQNMSVLRSVCLPAAVHIPSFGIIIIVIYDCYFTRHTQVGAFGFALKQNKRPLGRHIQQFRNSYTKVLPMELFAGQLNVRTFCEITFDNYRVVLLLSSPYLLNPSEKYDCT